MLFQRRRNEGASDSDGSGGENCPERLHWVESRNSLLEWRSKKWQVQTAMTYLRVKSGGSPLVVSFTVRVPSSYTVGIPSRNS